jgi:spermine synthase
MSVNTILMDFSVDPSTVKNESQVSQVCSNIENVLREHLTSLKTLTTVPFDADTLKLYSFDGGVAATLRVFNTGLITLNIEFLKAEAQESHLTFERTKVLEQKLRIVLKCYRSKLLPPIKRGAHIDVYILSSAVQGT